MWWTCRPRLWGAVQQKGKIGIKCQISVYKFLFLSSCDVLKGHSGAAIVLNLGCSRITLILQARDATAVNLA